MSAAYEGWAILELYGHRRLGGLVSEVEQFGEKLCRIDVPSADGATVATQLYGGKAIYCLTPTDEETARAVARGHQPAPVHRWQLPPAPAPTASEGVWEDDGAPTDVVDDEPNF